MAATITRSSKAAPSIGSPRSERKRASGGETTGAPARRPQPASSPQPDPSRHEALWSEYLRCRSRQAFSALVGVYTPYVASVAARMSKRLPPSVDPDDLCAAGNFGLMDAIGAFDPGRGVKFQTFALKRIIGAMNDSLRAQDIAPRLARRREAMVKRARDDFRKSHGRSPTEEELLRILHDDGIEARAILEGAAIPVLGSMSAAGEDGGAPRDVERDVDRPNPGGRSGGLPMVMPERELRRWLGRGLSRSEQLIIWLYYFEGLTMKEIGLTLGICEGRVSQIHALLLERLRARLTRE